MAFWLANQFESIHTFTFIFNPSWDAPNRTISWKRVNKIRIDELPLRMQIQACSLKFILHLFTNLDDDVIYRMDTVYSLNLRHRRFVSCDFQTIDAAGCYSLLTWSPYILLRQPFNVYCSFIEHGDANHMFTVDVLWYLHVLYRGFPIAVFAYWRVA